MAEPRARQAMEAESNLRHYLGLDFPAGTQFITIRERLDQHQFTAWMYRWPDDEPLPGGPLPFCQLFAEGYCRPKVMRLSRAAFGLQGPQAQRIGGLLACVPVRYGPGAWIGLPDSPTLLRAVRLWLEVAVEALNASGNASTDWIDPPWFVNYLVEDEPIEADLRSGLLLMQSKYFVYGRKIKDKDDWRRASQLSARYAPALVEPRTCVVIAKDTEALVDLLDRRDGELIALVSSNCFLWRMVYGAGAAYVPIDRAPADAPAWIANSDTVLHAAEISDAWGADTQVPIAARSAANFVARMMAQHFPRPVLIDTCHMVDTAEVLLTFRLLPVYVPWMEADLTTSVGTQNTHHEPPRPIVALHAGWTGMADWAAEFLRTNAGSKRRELLDELLREGI